MIGSAGNNLAVPFTKIYNNISFNFKIYMSRGNDGVVRKQPRPTINKNLK